MKREARSFVDQLDSPGWAAAEYGRATVGDRRLDRRLASLTNDLANQPGAPIPQACGTKTKINGAYNLVENDTLDPSSILAGHHRANLERFRREPVILAPADTTSFNFNRLTETEGLGPIGSGNQSEQLGLLLHSTQAFTPQGLPLGLIAERFWARPREKTDLRTREQKPFEEKESVRWRQSWQACQAVREQLPPGTLLVNIDDMEGDIYEVFAAALAQEAPRAELLIRSHHDRKVQDQESRLWDHLAQQPVAGTLQVRVPRHKKQPARIATLQIRFLQQVELPAPERKGQAPALKLSAVEAREIHPPAGAEPILWRLLTTLPVTNAEEAIQKVRWYAVRWSIEVFHKIVKTVCRAETHQMATTPRLERMLRLNLLVAWRIQVLTQVGRQSPDLPASDCFAENEWKALYSFIHPTHPVAAQVPSLGQMMQWIGRLGGFVRCKSNPYPGPITLARGLSRLEDLAAMWTIQETIHAKDD